MKPTFRKFPVFAIIAAVSLAIPFAAALAESSFEIKKPKDNWQVPGEIQVPKGEWQVPGDIQIPKGIAAVKAVEAPCVRTVTVVADALFDFDMSDLRGDAEETLAAAGPEIAKAGKTKMTVKGHTDSKGSDDYNQRLSEARAKTVRDWLGSHGYIPADTAIEGLGERHPVAENANPDGSDNPEGRQMNRRVEIDIDTCG